MKTAESIYSAMAMANLNVAIERLGELANEEVYGEDLRDDDWARLCCSYSRYVHKNVWRDKTDKNRVVEEIVPLLDRIISGVQECIKKGRFLNEDEMTCYAQNIHLRRGNLVNNYLNDIASAFPADVMEPRLTV